MYKCSVCGAEFPKAQGLGCHLRIKHNLKRDKKHPGKLIKAGPVRRPAHWGKKAENPAIEVPAIIPVSKQELIVVVPEVEENVSTFFMEKGDHLLEDQKTITKADLATMIEEVLSGREAKALEEKAKTNLQESLKLALEKTEEQEKVIGSVCQGVDCLREAIDSLRADVSTVTQSINDAQAPIQQEIVVPENISYPVAEPEYQEPIAAPLPRAASAEAQNVQSSRTVEHAHKHHEHSSIQHIASVEQAKDIFDKIMSCEECSPKLKEAFLDRIDVYFPELAEKAKKELLVQYGIENGVQIETETNLPGEEKAETEISEETKAAAGVEAAGVSGPTVAEPSSEPKPYDPFDFLI